jgi:hypothetical protein
MAIPQKVNTNVAIIATSGKMQRFSVIEDQNFFVTERLN